VDSKGVTGRRFPQTLDLQNVKDLAYVLGVEIPERRVARFQYIVKYFITSLSVRTNREALVTGNEGVSRERLHTEFTEWGAQRALKIGCPTVTS
jgi:hypothetical protein